MVDNSLREKLVDEKSRIIFDARMNYKRDKSLQSFYHFLKKIMKSMHSAKLRSLFKRLVCLKYLYGEMMIILYIVIVY